MRFPFRITVSISLLAVLALVGSFTAFSLLARGNAARAAAATSYGVTKGALSPLAVADPKKLTVEVAAPGSQHPKGAHRSHQAVASSHAPLASSSSALSTSGSLLEGFNGVSSRNSAKTNFGAQFEPPDQGLCVGNGFVVEPVNSAFTIYRAASKVVAGPFNVNKLFAEGFKQFTSDPRCYTAVRAGAAWFEVHPSLDNAGALSNSTSIVKQGYVVSQGNYLLYPAIQVSPRGSAALVLTLSGPHYFPSAVYTVMGKGQTSFGSIHIAGFGTSHYDPAAIRWGDYSWAILAPDGRSFWMATEYIPPRSSQTVNQKRDWGTFLMQVSA